MKFSIRWALILGFLGLIWGTHIITTTSSFVTSQEVLQQHAQDIMTNIAALAMEQSQNHLARAYGATALTKRLLANNVVSSDRRQIGQLEQYFFDQLSIYPHFAGIYIGTPNGDFYDVRRSNVKVPEGFRTKIITHREGVRQTRLIWRDSAFKVMAEEIDADDAYDPRIRPWYKRAVKANRIVWTDPYIFFTSQKPGITIAGPCQDAGGQIKGIVGVDIEIDQLSTFIASLKIGKNGRAFMMNRNRDIVAFPDLSKLKYAGLDSSSHFRLAKIHELDDPLSHQAFQAADFQYDHEGLIKLSGPQFARFEYQGKVHHAMFTPFSSWEWPWIVGVHLPEDDYLGAIKANRRFNMLVTLVISILAAVLGLLLARGVSRPIAALERETRFIQNNNFDEHVDVRSAYKEIQATADSFARMKIAINKSRKKYQGIFENIQDVYYEAGLDGTLLEISPSIERVSQYKRDEVLGQSLYTLYKDPTDRERMIEDLLANGKINDHEIIIKEKDGSLSVCSLNSVLVKDTDGQPLKIIGSLRNVTDRKNAEQELITYRDRLEDLVKERTADLVEVNASLRKEIEQRQLVEDALRTSEEKYRTILESIEEGYFEIDLAGNFTFVNEALVRILGFSRAELLGLNNRDYTSPQTAQMAFDVFSKIHQTGQPALIPHYAVHHKDQSRRVLEISAAARYDDQNQVIGFRGMARDITNRIQAEHAKQKLEGQLQQAQRMKAIGTLAGGIAHDFNNLLMGIQGNLSLLLLRTAESEPEHEYLTAIDRCVDSGAKLTRQLLGYARGGKYVVAQIDLNETVRRTIGLFGRTKKEINIHPLYQESLWSVEADQGQMDQVLVNLYLNAWQAMTTNKDVYLTTKNVVLDEAFTQPYGVPPGRYVMMAVRDSGTGMDAATQERIFEPFFTTKEMGIGTGLGLASVFGII